MNPFPRFLRNDVCLILLAVLSPVFLTQCKTTGGSYQKIEYDPATLKTPSGHGLQKKEYPFDDEGNYRKDWVKNKTAGKARSASKLPEPSSTSPAPASAPTQTQVASNISSNYSGYVGPATTSAAPSPPAPARVAPTATPQYHKVSSGDTLYSLARRYSTSVPELKRVNGLSSDSIRTGQSLRIP